MRTITVEVKVFRFKELDEKTKDKVIQRRIECNAECYDSDFLDDHVKDQLKRHGYNVREWTNQEYTIGLRGVFVHWRVLLMRYKPSLFRSLRSPLRWLFTNADNEYSIDFVSSVGRPVDQGFELTYVDSDVLSPDQQKVLTDLENWMDEDIQDLAKKMAKDLRDDYEEATSWHVAEEQLNEENEEYDEDGCLVR